MKIIQIEFSDDTNDSDLNDLLDRIEPIINRASRYSDPPTIKVGTLFSNA